MRRDGIGEYGSGLRTVGVCLVEGIERDLRRLW